MHTIEEIKAALTEIAEGCNLAKKIIKVQEIPNLKYQVTFDDDTICAISRDHIDDYIDSGDSDARRKIEYIFKMISIKAGWVE